MSKKKLKVNEDFVALKQWKESPPGPEQLELERMFENNIIDETHTSDSVRKMNTLFMAFSPKIFSTHYRKTKAKLGLFGIFFCFCLVL